MANERTLFRQLFDKDSSTYTYLIADPLTKRAIIIDPVLEQAPRDIQLIKELGLDLVYSLETHIHADHVTGAFALKKALGCKCIVPALANAVHADATIDDQDVLTLDRLSLKALFTPGHTAHHMCYLFEDKVFTGDCLLINACGRTDFQGGDSFALYDSVTKVLFKLPPQTLMYPAHDYRGFVASTIGEQIRFNPRFVNKTVDQFKEIMANLNLAFPKRMIQAVPKNLLCGNQAELIESLKLAIPEEHTVLNIGQDVSYDTTQVAMALGVPWQVACLSLYEKAMRSVIQATMPSLDEPLILKSMTDWGIDTTYDALYAERLFDEVPESDFKDVVRQIKKALNKGGQCFLYAIFEESKSPLHKQLNLLLKAKNPQYGVRSMDALNPLFEEEGFSIKQSIPLDLGYQLIAWVKD